MKQNRTDLGKCTQQRNKTQGNNGTQVLLMNKLLKVLVYCCFLVFCCIGEYIFLDLCVCVCVCASFA